jgi:putative ATPase
MSPFCTDQADFSRLGFSGFIWHTKNMPNFNQSPLAVLMRPESLDLMVGQDHLIGPDKPLAELIAQHRIYSMVFWGPPGVGKTTLARILARNSGRQFIELSAVSANKADIRTIVEEARQKQPTLAAATGAPVVFLDEIHRFTKAQQDFLLPYVEDGTIVLIGATTENPSFEVIAPLLSRLRVYILDPLSADNLRQLAQKAAKHLKRKMTKAAIDLAIAQANGDARQLLSLIESTYLTYDVLTTEALTKSGARLLRYDRQGEEHFDTISAFIKSMRASNVDAALYYLARMVAAGEDPLFIARRMVVFASEDIGMAQPTALVVANAVFRACEVIGFPECQENLAHGVVYLAAAKKDRRAYDAYMAALRDVKELGNLPIPKSLRNAPTKLMKEIGYGKGYEMYPDTSVSLLPEKIKDKHYFS